MEIIKYGKIPPQVKEQGTEITCPNCSSVLKYFVGDIKIFVNESEMLHYINCMFCSYLMVLK